MITKVKYQKKKNNAVIFSLFLSWSPEDSIWMGRFIFLHTFLWVCNTEILVELLQILTWVEYSLNKIYIVHVFE